MFYLATSITDGTKQYLSCTSTQVEYEDGQVGIFIQQLGQPRQTSACQPSNVSPESITGIEKGFN
jgi:hypothetical protein